MILDDQISLKRDEIEKEGNIIEALHVEAATHQDAYNISQNRILIHAERKQRHEMELEELKALRDRQRTEIVNVGERMTKAEENALAVGPQKPRWS